MKKIALITGASSGIGAEFAKIHATAGDNLILIARRKDKLLAIKQALEASNGISVYVIEKDLTDANAASDIYNEITAAGIEVDYLINNAGFGGLGKFHERDWETDHNMIQLNIVALTALTRVFLPDFVNRNSGKVLNVSSTAALMPGPMQAVYFATKAFVTSFSNAIAEELSNTNVTVTVLMPGATESEFGATSGMDKTSLFKNLASANEIAQAGYDGMMKGKLDVIAGLSFSQKIMMASLPLTPKKLILKQIRNMQTVK